MSNGADIEMLLRQFGDLLSNQSVQAELLIHKAQIKLGLFESQGKTEDLVEGIRLCRQGLSKTPQGSEAYVDRLGSLGSLILRGNEDTGNMEELEEGIRMVQLAMSSMPEGHLRLPEMRSSLGNAFDTRYRRTGNVDDLKRATEEARSAVKATPMSDPDRAGMLNNLGNRLGTSYKSSGSLSDLEESIRVTRQAVQTQQSANAKPPNHDLRLAMSLNNLGNRLGDRYSRTRAIIDLEEAIQVTRDAIKHTPRNHPRQAVFLNNLGNRLASRYDRLGDAQDLEEAIKVATTATTATPRDHPGLGASFNNLSSRMCRKFEYTKKLDDLKVGVQLARDAVKFTKAEDPDLAHRLSNLGSKLTMQYDHTKDVHTLEEAVRVGRQAIDTTPKDHPTRALSLLALGQSLRDRYEYTRNGSDLAEAIRSTTEGFECQNAEPFIRIRNAILALQLFIRRRDYEGAYVFSVKAVDLLPYMHNRSLSRADQQYAIAHFSGLSTLACSLALKTDRGAEAALTILEKGRGVILNLLMDDRSDTSKLMIAHPRLCKRYERYLLDINRPDEKDADERTRRDVSARRVEVAVKLAQCVKEIQLLDEFSQFHKGLTSEQMRLCAAGGSIVVINVTSIQSDAIVITVDGVHSLGLPGLKETEAANWLNQNLTMFSNRDSGKKNKLYIKFLAWLWEECVKPVLESVQYMEPLPADTSPRIWWIGTGLASHFPFHSAGILSESPDQTKTWKTDSTCYRAISSYTPTLKALHYAQAHTRPVGLPRGDQWKALVIAMPETPGASNLPGTREELREIKTALGSSAFVRTLDHPTAADALVQLQGCDITHFACHGVSHLEDPSESGLILQTARTATEEPQQDLLSVHKVSQTHLTRAEIAYLSACSTAQIRASGFVDEVLHVVSGFQVAGFRHVVGCLWPSDDRICVDVAGSFYSKLKNSNAANYQDRAVALALHKAVLKVRESDEYLQRPLLWAQYMHFGA